MPYTVLVMHIVFLVEHSMNFALDKVPLVVVVLVWEPAFALNTILQFLQHAILEILVLAPASHTYNHTLI